MCPVLSLANRAFLAFLGTLLVFTSLPAHAEELQPRGPEKSTDEWALAWSPKGESGDATVIDGTFSGTVYSASGTENAVDLSTLIGLPITGTFSYDSRALPLVSGGAGTCCSDFIANFPASPMVISDTVGGNTFTVNGTGSSALHTSMGPLAPSSLCHRKMSMGQPCCPVVIPRVKSYSG